MLGSGYPRKKIEETIAVLTFLKDHWKTIVGLIVGAKLLGAVRKLIKLVTSLRKLLRGIKPPRTPGGTNLAYLIAIRCGVVLHNQHLLHPLHLPHFFHLLYKV